MFVSGLRRTVLASFRHSATKITVVAASSLLASILIVAVNEVSLTASPVPSDFEVNVTGTSYDSDTLIGNWDVELINRGSSDGTLALTAVSSTGTTITESSTLCTATTTGWDCDADANSTTDIKLATSIKNLCEGRVTVTVGATLDGQSVSSTTPSGTVKHVTLGCPKIELKNSSYSTSNNTATWEVSVQRKLWHPDPGIKFSFGAATTYTGLPSSCQVTSGVLTCKISEFKKNPSKFTATQVIGRQCSSQSHKIIGEVRFADNDALLAVKPSTGLSVTIPKIDPCIKRIETDPSSADVEPGGTETITLNAYDGTDTLIDSLPAGASVSWSATRGTLTSTTNSSATYTAPSTVGDGSDQITATLNYADSTFTATNVS